MNVYVFQAALLCEACGRDAQAAVENEYGRDANLNADQWPSGPYPNGGGEADCPQHCDHCGLFLENPLTSDGVEYVRGCIRAAQYLPKDSRRRLESVALNDWAPFYRDVLA